MLSKKSVVVAAKDQVFSDIAGEVVILSLKTGVYHGLEGVGSRIWLLLQKPIAIAELQNKILNEYEVEQDRCENDLLNMLGELAHHGLVEIEA